jgi:DNA-binding LytR/AlgR family response regulator
VFLRDIIYIEALGNYSVLHCENNKIITQQAMGGIENQLPGEQFIRIHKSFIVAKAKILAIESAQLLLEGKAIPIGQTYKRILNEWIK